MKKLYDINVKKAVFVYCLALFVVYFLVLPTADMLKWKNAKDNKTVYTADELKMESIQRSDGENMYYSTDGDPQILIDFDHPQAVENVEIGIAYPYNPGSVVIYYKENPEDDFSELKRVVYTGDTDGVITVEIKNSHISNLRIDPTIYAGMRMEIKSITVNSGKELLRYYKISFEDCVYFTMIAGYTVSLALLIRQIYAELSGKKKKGVL